MRHGPIDELLTSKELAWRLKRSVNYVYAMKSRGFKMIAGRTTLAAALRWLSVNPCPRGLKRIQTQGNGVRTK
jgi:hypothetical protein